MHIYDVSVPISSATPIYPGDPAIEINDWSRLANGDSANVSILNFGLHSGTHIDAPAHFIDGGAKVDSISLQRLVGKATVIAVDERLEAIDENFVSGNCSGRHERILFKTRNSTFWSHTEQGFRNDYTFITPEAARRLVDAGLKLVGIDYLSVEDFNSRTFETHHILLSNGVVILEGLDLRTVPAGSYELICLPLRIAAGRGDGAPARVILRTLTDRNAADT
jgi:arylformamidase